MLVSMATVARAGFRCTLGNWACTASCVTLGQTSGICDGEGECQCSEKSIRLVVHKRHPHVMAYIVKTFLVSV